MILGRLAVALGLLSVGSVAAMAADLSLPPRPYAPYGPVYRPAVIYDWTACYVGLNAGGVWGRMRDDWAPSGEFIPPVVSALEANGSAIIDASGFTGGGQVGCNWQVGQVVSGLEADIQYTALDESRDVSVPASFSVDPLNFHEEFRSKWLTTFRGRFGWLATPFVLLYATGGLAVAQVETVDSVINLADPAEFNTVSGSETRAGWTIGGGVEWKFAQHWSVRAEYLFVDLGHFSTTSVDSLPPVATIDHDHHLTENIARAGLNFHF